MKFYNRKIIVVLLLVGVCLGLSACGIKPNNLDAPRPDYKPQFPQTYPTQ